MKEVATMYNIERLLKRSVQRHLSEDELGAYHDNVVDEVSRARIEAHLGRCQLCERRYAMMREVLATYTQELLTEADVKWLQEIPGQKAERQMDPGAILGTALAALKAWIRGHRIRVALAGASAAGPAKRHHGKTEDGPLFWSITEEEWGDFVVRLGSHRMELAGVKLLLTAGSIKKTVALEPVGKSLDEAKAIFTREERAKLPENVQLAIDIIT